MKLLLIATSILFTLISCSSGDKKTSDAASAEYTLDNFPKEWINVEQKDNKWIIFEPCDAGTPELEISKKNGKNIFTVAYGHDAAPHTIEQFVQNPDGSVTLTVKYEGDPDEVDPEIVKFTFHKNSQENIWTVKAPDNIESYYIEKQNSGSFTKVVQPCRECWEEADCAETEKANK